MEKIEPMPKLSTEQIQDWFKMMHKRAYKKVRSVSPPLDMEPMRYGKRRIYDVFETSNGLLHVLRPTFIDIGLSHVGMGLLSTYLGAQPAEAPDRILEALRQLLAQNNSDMLTKKASKHPNIRIRVPLSRFDYESVCDIRDKDCEFRSNQPWSRSLFQYLSKHR